MLVQGPIEIADDKPEKIPMGRTNVTPRTRAPWRRVLAAVTAAALSAGIITGVAAPANAAACGSAGTPTVAFISDPTFWYNAASSFDAQYIGYAVTAPAATGLTNVWVELSGFTGQIALAPNQPAGQDMGRIAAGATGYTYFLARTTAYSVSSTAQTHNVAVYDGNPNQSAGATLLCTTTGTFTSIASSGSNNANKVTDVSVTTTGSAVGSTATVVVTGDTGTIGNGPAADPAVISMAPTAQSSFAAGTWRLTSTSLTTPIATYNNILYRQNAKADQGAYTATYTFTAVNTSGATATVNPIQYIANGAQVSKTGSTVATLPTVPAVSNTLTVATAADKAFVPNAGGYVTYTTTVANSGASAVDITDVFDLLPAGVTFKAGTAKIDGASVADPNIQVDGLGRSTVVFPGPAYTIPASGSMAFSYQALLPAGNATLTNSATAAVSSTVLDTTLSTADNAPATASVLVAPAAPTVAAITPSTTGTAPVVFTPTTTGVGISTANTCVSAGTQTFANPGPDDPAPSYPACSTSITVPNEGTYTVNTSTGAVTFTAARGFTGTSTATYRVTDQYGQHGYRAISSTVAKPAAPEITGATLTTPFRTAVSTTPGASASTDPATACIVNGASCTTSLTNSNGTYTVSTSTGEVTFTPASTFRGATTPVTYRISDYYAQTGTATISVTVGQPKEIGLTAPENTDANYMTETHVMLGTTAGDGLIDSFCLVNGGSCGSKVTTSAGEWTINTATGEVSFTGSKTFTGPTTITARVTDDLGVTAQTTVKFTVAVPPAPTFTGGGNSGGNLDPGDCSSPSPSPSATATPEPSPSPSPSATCSQTPGTVAGTAVGPYGSPADLNPAIETVAEIDKSLTRIQDPADGLWKTSVTLSGIGTWTVNADGTFTFDPANEFAGKTAPLPVRVVDILGRDTAGTVSADIALPAPPVVDTLVAPKNFGQVAYVRPPIEGVAIQPASARIKDPADGQWKTQVTVPGQGTWKVYPSTGKIEFVGLRTFAGTATPLEYKAVDKWGQTDTATVTQEVALPAPPVVGKVEAGHIYGEAKYLRPSFDGVRPQGPSARIQDPADGLWKTAVTIPGQGQWKAYPGTGNVEFVALPGFAGTTSPVNYKTSDVFGQYGTNVLQTTVAQPPAPTLTPIDTTVTYGVANTYMLPGWEFKASVDYSTARLQDPADNGWKTSVTVAGKGTWTVSTGSGRITFVPARGFSGAAPTLNFRLADRFAQTATTTVKITVTPPAAPTVAGATTGYADASTLGQAAPVTTGTLIDWTKACIAISADANCVTSYTSTQGTWRVSAATGKVGFTPAVGFNGVTNTVLYRVTDAFGRTSGWGAVEFYVGQRTAAGFAAGSSNVGSSIRSTLSTFGTNLTKVPVTATVKVFAYVPSGATAAQQDLADARAAAVIRELKAIGITATRGADVIAADWNYVRVTSSYL